MAFDVFFRNIAGGFSEFHFKDAIDIIIIAILIYQLVILTKETRAYQVLKGLGLVFLAAIVSEALDLTMLTWLLNSLVTSGVIVAVILFQPELRRALEHIGRGRIFDAGLFKSLMSEETKVVSEMQQAILNLAKRRVGALIVIEQKTGLGDIITSGTRIDGVMSAPLLENIFEPNTPLHDGAVIVRDGIIVAAACFLPLADDLTVARELGTRHRAALGVSSISDSVTIVVSEETGVISFARDGKLVRYIDKKALTDLLESIFMPVSQPSKISTIFKRRKKDGK